MLLSAGNYIIVHWAAGWVPVVTSGENPYLREANYNVYYIYSGRALQQEAAEVLLLAAWTL